MFGHLGQHALQVGPGTDGQRHVTHGPLVGLGLARGGVQLGVGHRRGGAVGESLEQLRLALTEGLRRPAAGHVDRAQRAASGDQWGDDGGADPRNPAVLLGQAPVPLVVAAQLEAAGAHGAGGQGVPCQGHARGRGHVLGQGRVVTRAHTQLQVLAVGREQPQAHQVSGQQRSHLASHLRDHPLGIQAGGEAARCLVHQARFLLELGVVQRQGRAGGEHLQQAHLVRRGHAGLAIVGVEHAQRVPPRHQGNAGARRHPHTAQFAADDWRQAALVRQVGRDHRGAAARGVDGQRAAQGHRHQSERRPIIPRLAHHHVQGLGRLI